MSPTIRPGGRELSIYEQHYPTGSVHEQLESVMTGLAYDALEQAAPASSGPYGEKKVLDNVIFFTWHESYDMGP